MKEHANSAHRRCLLDSSTLISPQISETLEILSCFAQLFTNYQWMQNGRFYVVVQVTGKRSVASKYKSEFTLRAANGIEEISKIFFVRIYTEDFDISFNSGKCLCLHEGPSL
jgi:hypothetical protein